jgi:Putative glucoamylase
MFVPGEAMTTLRYMRTAYGDRIWGRYGFVDAFNPETGWVDSDVIGIDLGITLLQAENARTGLIWAVFMQAPEVQRALARAGFVSQGRDLPWEDQERMHKLAAQDWKSLESVPVSADSLGLRISSVLAATALGLLPEDDAIAHITTMLKATPVPSGERAAVPYAASLLTLRNAIPTFSDEATLRLKAIDWAKVPVESLLLGSSSRLTVFLQIASGARPVSAWLTLKRDSVAQGRVRVLEPANIRDQMLPGLWLDEGSIVTGASASQLAYAIAVEKRKTSTAVFPYDVRSAALLIEQLPAEIAAGLKSAPLPPGWLEDAPVEDRDLLLMSLANLLAPDCLREWFQQDSLVMAGRNALHEFSVAAFGGDNSLFARNELAIPRKVPPERQAQVVRSDVPRAKWHWIVVKGPDYRVSAADVRPGDPDLELRFALTWDKDALHFHANVMDTPAGFLPPAGRRSVEFFMNPKRDGLVWLSPENFQFAYRPDGTAMEWFHHHPVSAQIQKTAHGYSVDSDIKWTELGIVPQPGLAFDMTANVTAAGTKEWDPSLELSWRYYQRDDDRFGLGMAQLGQ